MALSKSREAKKVNLDFNKEFINTFTQNIENRNIEFINQTLKDLHEADVANLIENLNPETRTKLIEIESFNIDPEIFIELNESIQSEVLQLLSIESLIKLIKRLESDNAIKILENLSKEVKNGTNRELLWILEHPTTYTAGVSFNKKEIIDKKIKIVKSNRGGKIT